MTSQRNLSRDQGGGKGREGTRYLISDQRPSISSSHPISPKPNAANPDFAAVLFPFTDCESLEAANEQRRHPQTRNVVLFFLPINDSSYRYGVI